MDIDRTAMEKELAARPASVGHLTNDAAVCMPVQIQDSIGKTRRSMQRATWIVRCSHRGPCPLNGLSRGHTKWSTKLFTTLIISVLGIKLVKNELYITIIWKIRAKFLQHINAI
jgi:hypothetical protein